MTANHQVAEASGKYLAKLAGQAVPVGYKQTEVGVIPEDWSVTKIGLLLSITTGNKNTQDRVEEGQFPFFVRSQKVERIHSFSFDGEGVLTAGDGVGTGKIFHYINGKFDFHQRVYLMHNFGELLDGYYFYIFFSNNFYDRIMSMTAKSSVDSVRREMIADMAISLPPKSEQTAIANALSDVDALINELEKLIAKKQAIKTATMQQLLTGRTRLSQFALREDGTKKGYKQNDLGEIPEDWALVNLGDVCVFENGDRSSNYPLPNSFVEDGIPFINAGHVANGIINLKEINYIKQEAYDRLGGGKIRPGDILFCLRGSLGKYGVVSESFGEGAIASSLVIVRPKAGLISLQYLANCYMASVLCRKMIELWAGGAAQPNLGAREMAKFLLPLPSEKEQTAIATILSDMDAEIQTLQQRLNKTRHIKQGMMQELLTGRIRLVSVE